MPIDLTVNNLTAEMVAAIVATTDYERMLKHVRTASSPVGAARLAQVLKLSVPAAQRLLAAASSRGEVVRLTRGLYAHKSRAGSADMVASSRSVPNLSATRAAGRKDRTVITASGRTVTVSGGAQLRAAASKSGSQAAEQRNAEQAESARASALIALYITAHSGWSGSAEDHQLAGAWVASLPASVLSVGTVAELLASAKGA